MLKALARCILRNFINDLEWDIKELREKNAALKQQLHAADHDNAFLYEQMRELHLDKEELRQDNDNLRKRKEEVNRLLHCYGELYGPPF